MQDRVGNSRVCLFRWSYTQNNTGSSGSRKSEQSRRALITMLITASFGPISTRSILGRASLKRRVNACGKGLIQKFDMRSPQKSFMILSKGFAECVGLMSQRLSRLVTRLDSTGIKSSMTMLGESVFCIAPMEVVPLVTTFLRKHGMTPYASRIAKSGAHML